MSYFVYVQNIKTANAQTRRDVDPAAASLSPNNAEYRTVCIFYKRPLPDIFFTRSFPASHFSYNLPQRKESTTATPIT